MRSSTPFLSISTVSSPHLDQELLPLRRKKKDVRGKASFPDKDLLPRRNPVKKKKKIKKKSETKVHLFLIAESKI